MLSALFPGSIFAYLAVALGLFAAGSAAGYEVKALLDAPTIANAQKATSDCNAAREHDRADANAKTVTAIAGSVSNALAQDEKTRAAADARAQQYATFMEKLHALPTTKACMASPAMHALLDSVRAEPAAAP